MPRAPGDTSQITQTTQNVSMFKPRRDVPQYTYSTSPTFQSVRPNYAYGNRFKVGSTTWIGPTAYKHNSRTTKRQGTSSFRADYSSGYIAQSESAPDVGSFVGGTGGIFWQTEDSVMSYNTTSAAKVKALNSLADQHANIGESLATYLQTVRMFGSKSKLLADVLKAFKNGSLGKFANRSARDLAKNGDKRAAQAYLEFVYGWKPLVSDVYGTYQLLKEYASGIKPLIIHGHGSQTQSTTFQFETPKPYSSSASWHATAECTKTYKGTCDLYGRVDPELVAWRMLNQLGLLNPAALAWELTPWSFVVDWLVPIGPVLNAFMAPIGLNFISGTVASRGSHITEGDYFSYLNSSGGVVVEDKPCHFTVEDQLYARESLSTWPFPLPYLNLNPLSGDRPLKAAALAIANLRR